MTDNTLSQNEFNAKHYGKFSGIWEDLWDDLRRVQALSFLTVHTDFIDGYVPETIQKNYLSALNHLIECAFKKCGQLEACFFRTD